MRLLCEHLGIRSKSSSAYECLRDLTSDATWEKLIKLTARRNTEIYWRIFQCVPSDEVPSSKLLVENTIVIYENERWKPWGKKKWSGQNLLDSDPPHWCTPSGTALDESTLDLSKCGVGALPLDHWILTFLILLIGTWTLVEACTEDEEGWVYAKSFGEFGDLEIRSPTSKRSKFSFSASSPVRRRRWIRIDVERIGELNAVSRISSYSNASSMRVTADERQEVEMLLRQSSRVQVDCGCLAGKATVELEKALSSIHGHLVEFPLQFLKLADLRPKLLPRYLHI